MNTERAAKELNVSQGRVLALIAQGKLRATKSSNGRYEIAETDVDAVRARTVGRPKSRTISQAQYQREWRRRANRLVKNRKNKVDPKKTKMVMKLKSQGRTNWDIAQHLGVSETVVRKHLRRGGMPARVHRVPLDEFQKQEMIQLYHAGRTQRYIAQKLDIDPVTVSQTLRKLGFPRRAWGTPKKGKK